MAKAKKSESTGAAAPKKAPAKKAAAAKPAQSGMPTIDTSLAAENAARMLMASRNRPGSGQSNAPMQESAMFKQMKAGLNKPIGTTMSSLLEKSHGPEPAKSHPSMKQIGRDQTYTADVTRSGVPRRNPG